MLHDVKAIQDVQGMLRLAAIEAEALAWLTPFPHLFLPVLLEEKLDAARQYVTRQDQVRCCALNGCHC